MNPGEIMRNIELVQPGFWKSKAADPDVSYTRNGHELIKAEEANSFWFSHRASIIKKLIKAFDPGTILDVGGGNGQVSKILQDMDREVILLEPREIGARNAYEAGLRKVVNSTFIGAGIADNSISAITLLDVLEHIDEDEEFLIECYRILKPGGTIFITVPAVQSLYSEFDREVGHFRRYSLKQLTEKTKGAGFTIEYSSYFFYFLPVIIFLVRFLIYPFKTKSKRRATGHLKNKSSLGKAVAFFLKPELNRIEKLKKVPTGSSCLIVAKKPG